MKKIITLTLIILVFLFNKSNNIALASFPSSVGNLAGQWDASSLGSIISSGGNISQWNDLSGNGANMVQSSASKQPATGITTQNGLNEIYFDGGGRFMMTTDENFSRNIYDASGMSMFVMQQSTNSTGAEYYIWSGGGQASFFNFQDGGTFWDWNYNAGDTGGRISASAGTAPHILELDVDRVNNIRHYYIDGNLVGQQLIGSPSVFACSLLIGDAAGCTSATLNYSNGTAPWIGSTAELLFYNTLLGTAKRQYIEGYLACKWGIQSNLPFGHPYGTVCPIADYGAVVTNVTSQLFFGDL